MPETENLYSRNELYWSKEAQKALFEKHILVVGLGGVGSYAADALARSGIGNFTLIDFDKVAPSNINRQLIALSTNIGEAKTELLKERIKAINPAIQVNIISDFYTKKMNPIIEKIKPDFVIDAIDTVKYKIDLIKSCKDMDLPVITSMGAGNRIDPCKLFIADISEIKPRTCKFMRRAVSKLKMAGVKENLPVVSSTEPPFNIEKTKITGKITIEDEEVDFKKFIPASTPFVPPVAGYIMASYAVRKLLNL